MKVFHGPSNIAGAAELLARCQRQLGVDAESVCFASAQFAGDVDVALSTGPVGRIRLLTKARGFDVFHFYFGNTLMGGLSLLDVPFLKARGKRVFLYFCGCDIRDSKVVISSQTTSACESCWPQLCHPKRDQLAELASKVDGVFVSTPDLLDFVPNAVWLPQPVDLRLLRQYAKSDHAGNQTTTTFSRLQPIRVVHAPSNRSIKGTQHIERAVQTLQSEGLHIELLMVEGMSYENAISIYASADLAVDQLLIGAYGQFSVEAMALGLPVVCFIRDDLRKKYPNSLPITSADPESLPDVLRRLIEQRSNWTALGDLGKQFVEQYHDPMSVAKTAIQHYTRTI